MAVSINFFEVYFDGAVACNRGGTKNFTAEGGKI